MILKPSRPIFEFLAPLILLFFAVKILILGLERGDILIYLVVLYLLGLTFVSIYWINTGFKTIYLTDKIEIAGFFWGRQLIPMSKIKGYKIREVRKTKYLIKDWDLVLVLSNTKIGLRISQLDYSIEDFATIEEKMRELKIDFLGREPLGNQIKQFFEQLKDRLKIS